MAHIPPETDATFNLLPVENTDDDNGNVMFKTSKLSINGVTDDVGIDADVSLVHSTYQAMSPKDFHAEVRAARDVVFALSNSVVLLDVTATRLENIITEMLTALTSGQPEVKMDVTSAKNIIFAAGDSVVSNSMQGALTKSDTNHLSYDQAWLCVMSEIPSLTQKSVAFARLARPVNLGPTCQEAMFVILVVTPAKEKATKNIVETSRTFSSLFTDMSFRHALTSVSTKDGFRKLLRDRAEKMTKEHSDPAWRKSTDQLASVFDEDESGGRCSVFCRGLIGDIKRRLPHYISDYKDGFTGPKTPHKVTAAILFLYFACVLPNLAFGMLNSNNTNGAIGVKKILFSQMFGGIIFAMIGGQPLIVLLTTAPLALYTKIIFSISEDFDLDFRALFACVGLWNAGFLVLYSVFGVSRLMKWSSRSTEEIFSLFITFAFSADAIKDCVKDFNTNYHSPACTKDVSSDNSSSIYSSITTTAATTVMASAATFNNVTTAFMANASSSLADPPCARANSILFLLLMLATVWVGITLFNFTTTPYLTSGKREILADYALPISVLFVSFMGSFVFKDIKLEPFQYDPNETMFEIPPMSSLPPAAIVAAAGLGFSLSLLFFMDQNISSALVNTPNNKLKKGAAYHWDLLVVALINAFLSVFAFPWVHAALPHSPLHVRCLADHEERVEQGHVTQVVVHVRETRISGIVSHVLIGLSMFMLPEPLTYIPRAVLDGLFLYVAITALFGNQLYERVMLLFTEQAAYPPNHYIRRVPQRKIHQFTLIQLLQLAVLCVFGFSPVAYMKMVFPVLLMFLMPIRHKLVPKFLEPKYLKALDGH